MNVFIYILGKGDRRFVDWAFQSRRYVGMDRDSGLLYPVISPCFPELKIIMEVIRLFCICIGNSMATMIVPASQDILQKKNTVFSGMCEFIFSKSWRIELGDVLTHIFF